MLLLLLPYSWPLPYSSLYFSFSCQIITTSLITSRLDYCNSLLYNIASNSKDVAKLQCVQNCLARFVTQLPRFSHPVPLLKSLHFQTLYLCLSNSFFWRTFICYLFSMLSLATKPRELRSSGFHFLSVPWFKLMLALVLFQLLSLLFGTC